jgi:transcription-repair coupling factor (superfamily II helicase)
VLISTNIVENGIDISNANTIIINRADHFGLSELHQLRGRVGRSNRKAFCYLITPPLQDLSAEARRRLQSLWSSILGPGLGLQYRHARSWTSAVQATSWGLNRADSSTKSASSCTRKS